MLPNNLKWIHIWKIQKHGKEIENRNKFVKSKRNCQIFQLLLTDTWNQSWECIKLDQSLVSQNENKMLRNNLKWIQVWKILKTRERNSKSQQVWKIQK